MTREEALRAACTDLGHPPAVWSSSVECTFCHCGLNRYPDRIGPTDAILQRNRWEPIRAGVCATHPSCVPEEPPRPRRAVRARVSHRDVVETVQAKEGVL